jgi:hypothetical protein
MTWCIRISEPDLKIVGQKIQIWTVVWYIFPYRTAVYRWKCFITPSFRRCGGISLLISGKPSFVEAVLWRVTQFFYLLCSQFRQKASGWINKTLLLIKQQKCQKYFFINVWRKSVFDIYFTKFGTALTTILPILFLYCYKYCYSF